MVCGRPLNSRWWVPKWWWLRRGTPSQGTMCCTSGHSPFMTCGASGPKSFMANSVLVPSTTSVSVRLYRNKTWRQVLLVSDLCYQSISFSSFVLHMNASVSNRHTAAAADPPEGRPDCCSGVSHQCWVCQAAGTSPRPGRWRCPCTLVHFSSTSKH